MLFKGMIFKSALVFPFSLTLLLIAAAAVADKEECIAGLDIVQVQDITSSFDKLWPAMEKQVKSIMDRIEETGPDSFFGFATFGDKNVTGNNLVSGKRTPLGYRNDYCLKSDVPLQSPSTRTVVDTLKEYHQKAYNEKKLSGGGDWREGVFEALYRALISPKLYWRKETKHGKKVARVAVVVTDALTHLEGDVYAVTGKTVRPFDITADGMKEHKDGENYDCDKVDYPTIKQVVDLVKELNVYVMLLVAPGGVFRKQRKFGKKPRATIFRPAGSLANKGTKYQGVDGLYLWYRDQLTEAGLDNVFVAQLDPKMDNYAKAFKTGLDVFSYDRCEEPNGKHKED